MAKSYGLTMEGAFVLEKVATLPTWTPSSEGRMIYVQSSKELYMGTNTQWVRKESAGYGAAVTSFNNNDGLANGTVYFIDTSSGSLTGILPASPTIGNEIAIYDNNGSFKTHPFYVNGNGKDIMGDTSTTLDVANMFCRLIYNGTQWIKDVGGTLSAIGGGNASTGGVGNITNTAADATASDNDFIFVDTTPGEVTIKLPNSGLANSSAVTVYDRKGNFGVNKCIVSGNGNNIMGNPTMNIKTNYARVDFIWNALDSQWVTDYAVGKLNNAINVVDVSANYNADLNDFILADSTAGAFSITLPVSGALIDKSIISVMDQTGQFGSYAVTIIPADGTIDGNESLILDVPGIKADFIWDEENNQWKVDFGGSAIASTTAPVNFDSFDATDFNVLGNTVTIKDSGIDHDSLSDLQGGNGTDQYYHLTNDDYTAITGSNTANTFFSAPDGVNGVSSFRSIVANDIPLLTSNKISNFDSSVISSLSSVDGDIIPDADITRSLGSATKQWKEVFIGPGSLYVNGQKVIEESSGTIVISADDDQNVQLRTGGGGDIEFYPSGSGDIELKGNLSIQGGKNLLSGDGNQISCASGFNMNGEIISNIGNPVNDGDAVTKAYASNASNLTVGTLPSNILPSSTITKTQVASSESDMLSLTTDEGDVVIRTDLHKSYIKTDGIAGTMADFQELIAPLDSVDSVNGKTGIVVLSQDDVENGSTYVRTTNDFTDADKTKLAGIETNATADQTASEIKSLYESNSNTNAFTDANKTKLAGIETNATADQTAAEILTAIKTVDGAGSGLNADTVDGLQGTELSLVDGSRAFTGTVAGVTPINDTDLSTKGYVDGIVTGLDWQESILDKDLNAPPASPTSGDRYIVSYPQAAATGAWAGHDNEIAEWNGSSWDYTTVTKGMAVWIEDEDIQYNWNGTAWVKFGSTITHNNTSGIQGGTTNEYYHLTTTQHTDLTDGGNSTLHYHATDRNLNNATGVLPTDATHGTKGGGNLHSNATETVNGFMSSTDKTKLNGIEDNATADQTAVEIKTAYESNTNTNAFTDADKAKLNDIETNATADQTAVEIKTAYESNSNTNAFTDADQTKLNDIEDNATADQTPSEIKTSYESNADTNAFTDADQTKLNGIETNATKDQTATEILTAIKTVDGSGSGLDADKLDGHDSSQFLRSDASNTLDGNLTVNGTFVSDTLQYHNGYHLTAGIDLDTVDGATHHSGIYDINATNSANTPYAGWIYLEVQSYNTTNGDCKQIATTLNNSNTIQWIRTQNNHVWTPWYKIWNENTDGLGSGLDADKLDGHDSNYFAVDTQIQTALDTKLSTTGKAADADKLDGHDSTYFESPDNYNNCVQKSSFNDANVGDWNSGIVVSVTGQNWAKALQVNTRDTLEIHKFSVKQGDKYFFEADIDASNSQYAVTLGLAIYNSGGSIVGWEYGCTLASGVGWTHKTGTITIPNGVVKAQAWIQLGGSSNFGTANLTNLYITRYESGADVTETHNSATTTKLQTARKINGVSFDGTTDITVYDDTKLSITGKAADSDKLDNLDSTQFLRSDISGTLDGNLTVTGTITESSDEKIKENVSTITDSLDKVNNLRGVSFNKIDTPDKEEIGFIAQEVEKIVPELVETNIEGMKSVAYARTVSLLVEAIKEQTNTINNLKERIELLEGDK